MSKRYGMTIDLNRCVGCQTCTVACKHSNDTLPEVQWRQVLDVETGTYPDVQRLFLVTGCQHCAEPPCVPVCPTGATFQREDGLVGMEYDKCIGCGYCAVSCPYQARTIVHDQRWFFGEPTRQEEVVKRDERLGVAQKCTFCVEKIDQAEREDRVPGLDLDVTPACAASCIAQAIQFGDFNDENSIVSQQAAQSEHFQMHAELGTDPQIKYLYETPAVPGQDGGPLHEDHHDPASALTGKLQTFWDIRAASNFAFGGLGSGLVGSAWLADRFVGLPHGLETFAYAAGAVFIAFGLFSVFLEIGRKERFWRAVMRPQTSWMTREIYVVLLLFPSLLMALLTVNETPLPVRGDNSFWPLAAGVLGVLFLYCQSRIINAAKGIPAWRAPGVINLIVMSGLTEGVGMLAVAACYVQLTDPQPENVPNILFLCFAGFALSMSVGFSWKRYVRNADLDGLGPLAVQKLRETTPLIHLVAHILPVALLGSAFILGNVHPLIYGLGGLSAVIGGVLWKVILITKLSYQQGFSLPKRPQRGSGAMAAPRRGAAASPEAAE